MVIILLQPWFNFFIEGAKECTNITIAFDFKKTSQTVTMSMQIAAFVFQCLVTMSRVEFVIFLNDHHFTCTFRF